MKYLFAIAAGLCFAIALLGSLGVVSGVDQVAWVDGGLLSFVLAVFVPAV